MEIVMSSVGEVHWHEGLFLQPHHLQMMQRHLLGQFGEERSLGWPHPSGLVEAEFSQEDLGKGLVRFERLKAVMPSGLFVRAPGNAAPPERDINDALARSSGPVTVRLGVPLYSPTQANLVRSESYVREKRLYRTEDVELPDENTGERPRQIRVRRLNLMLLVDGEDDENLEVLPLMRIVTGAGDESGKHRLDRSFIPPCCVVSGWRILQEMLSDLAAEVRARRNELVVQMTRGGFSIDTMHGSQFEQMLRLRTLNVYSARLEHLVKAPAVSPFAIYLELRSLLGELAGLHPDRDQYEAASYNHRDPAVTFGELREKIRGLLEPRGAQSYLKVAFARQGGLYLAELTQEHFSQPTEYLLGIETKQDPRAVAELVEDGDKFKLMPRSLTGRAVYGVKLQEERHPPSCLPAKAVLHYFRLLRSESREMWQRAIEEKALTVQWPGAETSDFSITLYMPVSEESEARR